ncbi:MAG TPA: hypothetical protein VFQ25_17145 [Ktedonobacterales bacterium]|nr:hypothetical protein [Ktedonobacterales bacterium]
MPTRRTISESFRLFGVRFRYSTSQTLGPSRPNVQVHLTGRDLMEMRRQIEQMREQEAETQRQHLATLNGVGRWLHTPLGAIATLAVFIVGLGLGLGGNIPLILLGLPIALAVIDWRDFSSFHGAIPWNVWRAEGKNGRWWTLATTLALYGWLFMPAVYAIQAWRRAGEVRDAAHAALDAKIAALEAQVLPAPAPVIPPPPPPNPITRRYATDDEYTQGATSLAAEGWNVSKVARDKDNTIVATYTHRTATPPTTQAEL